MSSVMDPELARWFEQIVPLAPRLDIASADPEAAARKFRELVLPQPGEADPGLDIADQLLPGTPAIPVRVYRPAGAANPPVIMNFHGGGWVLGSIAGDDSSCRQLVHNSGCAVVSVEYRLAPEHRFPAAVEDCLAATLWIRQNGASLGLDPTRMSVTGASAGANLAAAVALQLRDLGHDFLRMQMLVYPVCDHRQDSPSWREHTDQFPLPVNEMAWFWDQYTPGAEQRRHWLVSVIDAASHAGLPPAHVITADLDPLRDEGLDYARKLALAGVPVSAHNVLGVVHGFLSVAPAHPLTLATRRDIGARLAAALAD